MGEQLLHGARPGVHDLQQDSNMLISQQDLNPLRLDRLLR